MRQFWDLVIRPVLEAARPSRVIEIGVDQGLTTALLVDYATEQGMAIDAIDPRPNIDTEAWAAEHASVVTFHRDLSVNVLPELEPADVALIDGDHNWYTVNQELTLLERAADDARRVPPIVLLHDVGWPYARRDLYYDAETIPPAHRQPHERGGVGLGSSELIKTGLNAHLDHAGHEHGPRNGVRTAVEDFVEASPLTWSFMVLPGVSGLGILVPAPTLDDNGKLRDLLEQFAEPAFLTDLIELVERTRIDSETARQAARRTVATLARENDELGAAVAKAERELASARDRVADLEATTAAAVARTTAGPAPPADAVTAAAESAALDARLTVVTQQAEDLRDELKEARIAERVAAAQARGAREEVDELTRARERAERRHTALELRENDLEEQLTAMRRKLREAVDRQEDAEQRQGSVERRAAELERALAATREQAERAERDLAATRRELTERVDELTHSAAARARLAADIEDTRESLERAAEDARAQAGTARVAARELRERLEVREIESEGMDEQLRLLRQSLAETRADAELAAAERDAFEHRIADAMGERDALARRLAATLADRPAAPSAATPAPRASPAPDPEPPVAPEQTNAPAPIDATVTPLSITFTEPERQAHADFRGEYTQPPSAGGVPDIVDAVALPSARDRRNILVAEHPIRSVAPTVDVVVCVHDALADVRLCLWSIMEKSDQPLRLILVNDGSDEATTAYLRQVAADEPAIHLIHRREEPHGYTIAANLGLRAATGDYVILLNSDTVVTLGWLGRIVRCGESDQGIGILGPLSNAASHQSVPALRTDGAWSTNPLPGFTNPDGVGALLARATPRRYPRLPFINGFCYAIKRVVIDTIGYFDEERFASGYCEENDYSLRAADAGFSLAVVDDAYVFHAKSRSFTAAGRKVLAKRNYEIFLDKHGRERVEGIVAGMEADTALAPLRASVSDALSTPSALASALDSARLGPLQIVFVLPGLGAGGSGGSHSIYQEVAGLRMLGLDAKVALWHKAIDRARRTYAGADEVFVTYRDLAELAAITASADVISATHYKSATLVAQLHELRRDFLPAYYVQDYEPFFTAKGSSDALEALASYTLIPECLLFAKTHWLCNIVAQRHGVHVAKVEPSIDERVYNLSSVSRSRRPGPLRVAAMVRPRTPRRQPSATVAVLERVSQSLGRGVEVTTFGCPPAELAQLTAHEPIVSRHRGLLSRGEVAELLARTDVFLDLSMYQAFGRTALEAMACGATAVVPRLGGVWEFVEHRENAIAVDAFTPQEAVDALTELAGDRELLERLRQGARERASGYSVLRAALSEYLVFADEHARRVTGAERPV
jgi:GT2 family glycosyltransferase/glycosyltransferase involved in cell wall biosynthesis/predicted  nucleic acid-binding Zn-ribbon protein